jgi:hypothetical protein
MSAVVTSVLIAASLAANSPCVPKTYVILFGGQAEKFRPHTAHTWATFVRGTPASFETFTISWLPVDLPVRPLRLFPAPGRNYGLHETMRLFNTGKQELSVWGPYQICPTWYDEAFAHSQRLESGTVQHITLDRGPLRPRGPVRRPDLSHCVHAVTRTNDALRQSSSPILGYGEFITRKVAERMDAVGLLIQPTQTHDWLLSALDLERYPIVRRRIGEPLLKFLR